MKYRRAVRGSTRRTQQVAGQHLLTGRRTKRQEDPFSPPRRAQTQLSRQSLTHHHHRHAESGWTNLSQGDQNRFHQAQGFGMVQRDSVSPTGGRVSEAALSAT